MRLGSELRHKRKKNLNPAGAKPAIEPEARIARAPEFSQRNREL